MSVEHHTHTGENAGPKLNTNECLVDGAFNQSVGTFLIDPVRVELSYVGFCYVEPTPSWMSLFQILGKMGNLEAKADEAYTNASLVAA